MKKLSNWILGFSILIYVSLLGAPATAAGHSGVSTLVKVCPDESVAAAPSNLVGRIWGYADVWGPYIALGALAVLVILGAIPRFRQALVPWVVWPLVGLFFFSVIVSVVTSIPGSTCY